MPPLFDACVDVLAYAIPVRSISSGVVITLRRRMMLIQKSFTPQSLAHECASINTASQASLMRTPPEDDAILTWTSLASRPVLRIYYAGLYTFITILDPYRKIGFAATFRSQSLDDYTPRSRSRLLAHAARQDFLWPPVTPMMNTFRNASCKLIAAALDDAFAMHAMSAFLFSP